MRWLRSTVLLILTGCGAGVRPSAHLTGHLELASFPAPAPTALEATDDQGEVRTTTLGADGAFDLKLDPEQTWTFRVTSETGGYPVALPRLGHFDRGLVTEGPVEARLGRVWLPDAGSDVTRVQQSEAASCPDGQLESGAACAVLEALVSCADGPARPVEDPTSLWLGAGTLGDLPGAQAGVRYAVPSHVPPPILWECGPPQPQ